MKMAYLWLGFLFVASVASYTITKTNVDERLRRIHSVFAEGERQFAIVDRQRCVEKMMCLVERHIPDHNTLKYVSKYLTNEHNDIGPEAFSKIKTSLKMYPYMDRMVESIYIGRNSTDNRTCSATYTECTVSDRELLAEAHKYNANAQDFSITIGKRGWGKCAVGGGGCAVAGVSCGLCTYFTLGWCGGACVQSSITGCAGLIASFCVH